MLSKEKAVDRQMNDSVAERVASEFSIPVHIGKETGADEESIYDADGGFVCECNSKSRARVISEALNAISTLTAAKDAEIDALRSELTALREAAEGAKAIIKPFLNDIGGLKGKFHRGKESNERGEALLKVYDQLTADIATTAISPAADEPIVVGGKVCKFYLNQFNRFKGRWSIHSGTYHMHLGQWTCKTDERDHFLTEQFARDFARQCAAKE